MVAIRTALTITQIVGSKDTDRVLILTVATHREPYIDLLEQSIDRIGAKLHVAGLGETFQGYGWKLKKVLQAVKAMQHDYDYVLFTDAFDTYLFCGVDEILQKFKSFNHPMVVSAEVNLWPNADLASELPASTKTGHYPYPNSGGYMAEIPYLLELFDKMAIAWKSDCVDDQGELIKALALDNNAYRIDHEAVLFQLYTGLMGRRYLGNERA